MAGFPEVNRSCAGSAAPRYKNAASFAFSSRARDAVGVARLAPRRSVQLLANGVLGTRQAVGDNADVRARMGRSPAMRARERQTVLLGRAGKGHAGRLGRLPTLPVVDAPGVHHHDRCLGSDQTIGNFDDSSGVVRKPPGAERRGRPWRRRSTAATRSAGSLRPAERNPDSRPGSVCAHVTGVSVFS